MLRLAWLWRGRGAPGPAPRQRKSTDLPSARSCRSRKLPESITVVPANSGFNGDRNELSGGFGDIGPDVPLIVGLILAAHLDPASVLHRVRRAVLRSGVVQGLT